MSGIVSGEPDYPISQGGKRCRDIVDVNLQLLESGEVTVPGLMQVLPFSLDVQIGLLAPLDGGLEGFLSFGNCFFEMSMTRGAVGHLRQAPPHMGDLIAPPGNCCAQVRTGGLPLSNGFAWNWGAPWASTYPQQR